MPYLTIRILLAILLASFCLWLQLHTFINSNILWLMHAGAKLLAGGSYYYDFVEVNPPMCIYIYLPAVILHHYLSISFIASIIIYLFLLTFISWSICAYLLTNIFVRAPAYLLLIFEFTLAFSYFVLPAFSFGEREYLLIVLSIPYLLLAVLRLSNHQVNKFLSIAIGVMAAVGFAQKPYFIPVWLGIELYMLIRTQSLKMNFRPEAFTCIMVFLLYGISIFLLTPEYVKKILLLITNTYYLINKSGLGELIVQPVVWFAGLLISLSLLLRKKSAYPVLHDLLIITLLSSILLYLAQQTVWNYHMLPAYMVGALLLALLAAEFIPQYNIFKIEILDHYFYKTFGLTLCFALLIPFILIVASKSIAGSLFYTHLIFNQPVFNVLKKIRGQTVYIFTNDQIHDYLLIDYSQTVTPSKFPSLWLIAAADELANTTTDTAKKLLASQIAEFVRATESTAIIRAKPAYIFVQNDEYQISNGRSYFWTNQFEVKKLPIDNHLQFFLQNKAFAKFWLHYRYLGQAGNFSVYKIK